MVKKAIAFLLVAIIAMSAMVTVFGQQATAPSTIEGWDCSQAAVTGKCFRKLETGDTGWTWAGKLWKDNEKYTRFKDANPNKVNIRKEGNKVFLDWTAGNIVEISHSDLQALAQIPPTAGEVIVLQSINPPTLPAPVASWFSFPWILIPLGLLAALMLYAAYRLYRRFNTNPAHAGPPQGPFNANYVLGQAQNREEVLSAFGGRILSGYTRIWRVDITGRFPMVFGDGTVRSVNWNNHLAFVGERRNEQGAIVEVKIANASCLNISEQLNERTARELIRSNPTFSNPSVYARGTNSGASASNWAEVETFLRDEARRIADPELAQATTEEPLNEARVAEIVQSEIAQARKGGDGGEPTIQLLSDGSLGIRAGTVVDLGQMGRLTLGEGNIIFGDSLKHLPTGMALTLNGGDATKQIGDGSTSSEAQSATAAG